MAVRYTTVDGQVLCENRGGVKTLFMPDTLGNVIETRNMDTGAQTSSTTYWPYGEVRTQTGTNPSPFGLCGVWGYYTQAGQPTYVRARHYRPNLGRWQTVDPIWPLENPYEYVNGTPTSLIDPNGLQSTAICIAQLPKGSNESPCEGNGSVNACIALLCSGKTAYEIIAALRAIGKLGEAQADKLIRKGVGQILENLESPSPNACCRDAKSGRIPLADPRNLGFWIGAVCRGMGTDVPLKWTLCYSQTDDFLSCWECCGRMFGPTYTVDTKFCEQKCSYKS